MKKYIKLFIVLLILITLGISFNCYAKSNIVLNNPVTNDEEHTFKYPNLEINNSVKPYSITLSIENGYFNTNNEELNNKVSEYFDFRGGSNISNEFIDNLNTTEKYKIITFSLISAVDINDDTVRSNVIKAIKEFLSDILFYNEEGKDAKFTLSFSEVELKFDDEDNYLSDLDVIAFKDPTQAKEHYYMKIDDESITWTDAYNIATSLTFNGLQGYLVTITSEAEHNFIYQSLGSFYGWMGAASIENAEDITYNQKDIEWNPAYDQLPDTGEYGSDPELDADIETYWYWVAGPEAGQKLFDGYTNFNNNEPNNCGGYEWAGQYGNGADGSWNDFRSNEPAIKGYYVEFGGFEDEESIVKPVTLVSTFKWKDYDFRNIEQKIDTKIEEADFDSTITEEEMKELIESAIEDSGVEDVSYKVTKSINDDIMAIDIEVSIGGATQKVTYNIHIEKEVEVVEEEIPEEKAKNEKEKTEPKDEKNPKTGDNITLYVLISTLSMLGIVTILNKK